MTSWRRGPCHEETRPRRPQPRACVATALALDYPHSSAELARAAHGCAGVEVRRRVGNAYKTAVAGLSRGGRGRSTLRARSRPQPARRCRLLGRARRPSRRQARVIVPNCAQCSQECESEAKTGSRHTSTGVSIVVAVRRVVSAWFCSFHPACPFHCVFYLLLFFVIHAIRPLC